MATKPASISGSSIVGSRNPSNPLAGATANNSSNINRNSGTEPVDEAPHQLREKHLAQLEAHRRRAIANLRRRRHRRRRREARRAIAELQRAMGESEAELQGALLAGLAHARADPDATEAALRRAAVVNTWLAMARAVVAASAAAVECEISEGGGEDGEDEDDKDVASEDGDQEEPAFRDVERGTSSTYE